MDAWSCLRDGFVESSTVPFTETRPRVRPPPPKSQEPEATAIIFHEPVTASPEDDTHRSPVDNIQTETKITAVDHDLLASPIFREFGLDKPSVPSDVQSSDEQVPLVEAAPVPAEATDYDFAIPQDTSKDTSQETEGEDPLSASMQSLVDGLMSWGGQFAAEEDITLPSGMAASIVIEEHHAMNAQN